jgi:hypothetical protein
MEVQEQLCTSTSSVDFVCTLSGSTVGKYDSVGKKIIVGSLTKT